ncbi:MAG: hypothetical protein FH757_04465 [Alcanivorax sp.]|nr:hypothetical protein [Alcanivorax sp.]
MKAGSPYLKDGADWSEHEYYLVGDDAGLRNLMGACEAAIENGEARREDLGDYIGVKCLSPTFFEKPNEHSSSFETAIVVLMVALAVTLMLIGLYTVGTWLF